MSRVDVLRNAGDTGLTKRFFDDGVQVDPSTVTVTVTAADGTIRAADASTVRAGSGETASFAYTLQAAWLTDVDTLTVAWKRGDTDGIDTDIVHVVGRHLFSLVEMRAFDSGEYADTDDYPNDVIADVRSQVTDYLEAATRQAWVPRLGDKTLSGTGTNTLRLPHHHVNTVLAVWIDTVALTPTQIADIIIDGKDLVNTSRVWPSGVRNIRVLYDYGRTQPAHGVGRVAMVKAASLLGSDDLEWNTESASDEGVNVSYAEDPTEVSRFIEQHSWKPKARSVEIA